MTRDDYGKFNFVQRIANSVLPDDQWQRYILVFLLCVYGYLSSHKINFVTADLGRHLKNGELFFEQQMIPTTNLYSYTYPNHPFVNHHWGSGVIFYLVKSLSGFVGLSLFYLIASLITFSIFFHVAWKFAQFDLAALVALSVIPVLGSRTEIRPELFSYLFSALFFWIGLNYIHNRISSRALFVLPLLELLWVNLHIYFPLGIVIIALFLLETSIIAVSQKDRNRLAQIKVLASVLLLSLFATLANPFGLAGAFYPLGIFEDYGYRLVENQSVWFIEKLITFPPARYFKLAFILLLVSWIIELINFKKKQFFLVSLVLSILFSVLAWTAIRNFTLFGYFALPIIAINLNQVTRQRRLIADNFLLTIAMFLILVVMVGLYPAYWSNRQERGFGLRKGVTNSAEFFLKEQLQGSILNNYDIGSYLIYYLYPKEPVFVDNRPEAYPATFFKQTYIPLQEKEERWQELDVRYNFNVIFFYRHDATPWGQHFLVQRVDDPQWAPVYVDDYAIIFLKRKGPNQGTIDQYELPQEIFSTGEPVPSHGGRCSVFAPRCGAPHEKMSNRQFPDYELAPV